MMDAVLLATILAIFTTMALALWRAIAGPSVYDTIVGVNVFGTKTVLLIALITYFGGNDDLIDVAIVYALINFLAVIAVLKLVRHRDLAAAPEKADD
ncbi:monovalent cation/H+ antiporter complex subunit F [Spiribacter sp. 2438]|uniref:monovalent cation/H+ antiporter complex subunit F n=1 Tax=Spiribacter sp. 2438 TaxID=2666185 RepID=UPI001E5B4F60|nr:monovalent cation/H+ antiporter complex subunit F [Spiribacter sp. 2438]